MTIATMKPGINTPNTGGLLGNLSDGEKKELANNLNAPDLELIEQRKKKLFEDIKAFKENISDRDPLDIDLLKLLGRLLEHGVEDGIKLAQTLKITPYRYARIVSNDNFYHKHPEICEDMLPIIRRQGKKIEDKTFYNRVQEIGDMYVDLRNQSEDQISFTPASLSSPIASKLLTEMDDIYSQYLRIQEFKTENPNDPRTTGERLAEDLFQNMGNAGKYYKTRVVEAIYDNVVKGVFPAKDNYYSSKDLKVKTFLSKILDKINIAPNKSMAALVSDNDFMTTQEVSDVINIIKANPADLNYDEKIVVPQIEKQLKDAIYKPLNITFHMKNYLAEKQNKAEMGQVLASKFGKDREKIVQLVYDKKEGVYKVEPIEGEEEKESGTASEKAVLAHKILTSDFTQVGDPKIINGKVVFKGKTRSLRYLGVEVKEKWSREISRDFDEIGDYIGVGGKTIFTAKEGGIWKVMDENGRNIIYEFDSGETIKHLIEFNGKRLIVIREGDSDYIVREGGTKWQGPYRSIKDLHVVDNELNFKSNEKTGYQLHKIDAGFTERIMGPYNALDRIGDRDSPYIWLVINNNDTYYGIDKNGKETEGSFQDIFGSEKNKAFEVQKDTKTGKYYTTNKIGMQIINGYDELYGPREHNGKKIFVGKKGNDFDKRVVNDSNVKRVSEKVVVEKTIGIIHPLIFIGEPKIINGKVFYKVQSETTKQRYMINEDDKIIGERYDEIGDYIDVGGKLFFTARKGGQWMVIDEDGNGMIRLDPGITIEKIIDFNGKRALHTKQGDNNYVVFQDRIQGVDSAGPYKYIDSIDVVDNKLTFITKSDDLSSYYLHEGSIHQTGPYDWLKYQGDRDTPYPWIAKKNDKYYGIDKNRNETEGDVKDISGERKHKAFDIEEDKQTGKYHIINDKYSKTEKFHYKKISDEYDKIYGPREHNGKTIFIGKKDNTFQKLVINTEGEAIPLTEFEQKKLDLLNLCVPLNERPGDLEEYKDKIEKHLTEESKLNSERKKTGIQKLKTSIQQSGGFLSFLNTTIKQLPGLFIDTLPAKKDKNEKILAEEICRKIFPEAFVEEERGNSWYRGIGRNGSEGFGNQEIQPEDYLTDLGYDDMAGGDPEAAPQEIMKIRGTLDDIITIGTFGSCDEQGRRGKVYFPIDVHISGPQKITTINIPKIRYNTAIILAKPTNANIIPERVKGITKNGKEIDVPISTNALNESTIIVENKNIKEIVYSIEQSVLHPQITDISSKEYEGFKKRFVSMQGEGGKPTTPLLAHIAQLDEEELLFLDSIKNDTPKQQLIKIEQYVRKHSFYDKNNNDVANLKAKKSIDEKMYVCKKRIDELKEKKIEISSELEDKKRAGVCADFATITIAMLRQAGFLSGVISGFMSSGSTVSTADAHGVGFAILPDEKGKNQIVIVDGTPHGSGNDRPSLEELEIIRNEQEEKIEKELEASLEEITKVLNSGNKDEIDAMLANMYNGNLEDLLNVTLKKDVRKTHYIHLHNLLNAYRYSPIKDSDLALPKAQEFINQEMQREDSGTTNDYKQEAKAGTMLFEMTHQFVDRFTKDNGNKYQALDRLDAIIDVCKNLLNTIEYKSIKIIIKYLRAEKMKGKMK